MRRFVTTIALAIAFILPAAILSTGASAAEQVTTFSVENMTCALCPITVRKAMEKVTGVRSVEVDLEAQTATVTYDSAVATPADIGAASTGAGYPAKPVGGTS